MKNHFVNYYPAYLIAIICFFMGAFITQELIAHRYKTIMPNYDEAYGGDISLEIQDAIVYGTDEEVDLNPMYSRYE